MPDIDMLGRGEYAVGATTVTVDDGVRGRPLTVEVWFPIDTADVTDQPAHVYSFVTGDSYTSVHAVSKLSPKTVCVKALLVIVSRVISLSVPTKKLISSAKFT